jgi:hypothetical protein
LKNDPDRQPAGRTASTAPSEAGMGCVPPPPQTLPGSRRSPAVSRDRGTSGARALRQGARGCRCVSQSIGE